MTTITTITLETLAAQVDAALAGKPAQTTGDAALDRALAALATRERPERGDGDARPSYW